MVSLFNSSQANQETLGALERTIMELLWSHDTALSSSFIREKINKNLDKPLAITTILTVLSRLEKKHFVQKQGKKRPFSYAPQFTQEEYTAQLMSHVLEDTSNKELVFSRFLGTVSDEDAAMLKKLISNLSSPTKSPQANQLHRPVDHDQGELF